VSSEVRKLKLEDDDDWGVAGRGRIYFSRLVKALGQMTPADRNLLFAVVRKIAKQRKQK
jgi:hypothetical protein